jgi:hypothetical protein
MFIENEVVNGQETGMQINVIVKLVVSSLKNNCFICTSLTADRIIFLVGKGYHLSSLFVMMHKLKNT